MPPSRSEDLPGDPSLNGEQGGFRERGARLPDAGDECLRTPGEARVLRSTGSRLFQRGEARLQTETEGGGEAAMQRGGEGDLRPSL